MCVSIQQLSGVYWILAKYVIVYKTGYIVWKIFPVLFFSYIYFFLLYFTFMAKSPKPQEEDVDMWHCHSLACDSFVLKDMQQNKSNEEPYLTYTCSSFLVPGTLSFKEKVITVSAAVFRRVFRMISASSWDLADRRLVRVESIWRVKVMVNIPATSSRLNWSVAERSTAKVYLLLVCVSAAINVRASQSPRRECCGAPYQIHQHKPSVSADLGTIYFSFAFSSNQPNCSYTIVVVLI
jgi:hypothetical protein